MLVQLLDEIAFISRQQIYNKDIDEIAFISQQESTKNLV